MKPTDPNFQPDPYLAEVYPYIQAIVDKLQRATISRAIQEIDSGDLSPALAHALWLEMWAAEKLAVRLKAKSKGVGG